MTYDMQQICWRLSADMGLLVIPRGLNGHSTTEWLDCGLDGGIPHEPIPWLRPSGYRVTSLGIAFWCDEPSLWRNHLRLRKLSRSLQQSMVQVGVTMPNRTPHEIQVWLHEQFERRNMASGLSFSMVKLLIMLDWVAAELDIAQSGSSERSYVAEYLEYGFYFLRVTRGASGSRCGAGV